MCDLVTLVLSQERSWTVTHELVPWYHATNLSPGSPIGEANAQVGKALHQAHEAKLRDVSQVKEPPAAVGDGEDLAPAAV